MPGLVSTLLNQAYSIPGRLVQTFLQVTEQVWQPMHLSRFSTMPICALTFMGIPQACCASRAGMVVAGVSSQSTLSILRTTTNSSRLVPMVP
jgi:hypothetical protein